jgi:hypothetical protein
MKIKFGLDLDGYIPRSNCLDEVVGGPLRLLDLLETRLGLKGRVVCQARRILEYRNLLEAAASSKPQFYSRSLEQDPIATAQVLLQWRDQLIEAGWSGESAEGPRLRDLACVEEEASGKLSPGGPDRLRRVLDTLDERDPQLAELMVLDPPQHLPHLWRLLFGRLKATFAPVDERWVPPPKSEDSDLARIQRALLAPSSARLSLQGDGSFQIVTAYSAVTLAHALPQWAARSDADENVLLIADGKSNLLDLALERTGEPRLGLHPFSLARAVPQVLRLALRLHWRPLDPQHLLEFLTHPVCPVQGKVRRALANAVRACPGTGNRLWIEAIEAVKTALKEELKDDPAAQAKMLERIDEDVDRWIEVPRHEPSAEAPASQLARCCAGVAAWAGARAASVEKEGRGLSDLYYALAAMASDLSECLRSLPTVTHAQLERLLEEVCGTGWRCALPHAEAGHWEWIAAPGAVIAPAGAVLWWNCVAPSPRRMACWTDSERAELAALNIHLPSLADAASREHARWLRPILAAHSRLVLFCPRQSQNEPAQPHPVINRLAALLEKGKKLPTLDLDQTISATETSRSSRVRLIRIGHHPLAPARRWWKLPCRIEPRTTPESFSSAEKFIFHPYAWVLTYKARLRPGLLWQDQLMDGGRQMGVLLHRVGDLLFAPEATVDWRASSREEFEEWLRPVFDQLIESEGCNLLILGRLAEQKQLLKLAQRSLWELVTQLRKANVRTLRMALKPAPAPFIGGQISGEIDLLAESDHGLAVVDLKLGGYKQKREQLEQNLQLQLAIYSFLQSRGESDPWPASAFFVLTRKRLLAQNKSYFSGAEEIRPVASPHGTEVCWREFEKIWQWRRAQLDDGWVELTLHPLADGAIEAGAPGSAPPIPRWRAGDIKDSAFKPLTGWEANQ